MSRSVLILSVHPDDETLGAGGTILRHVARGDQVHWVIVTAAHPPQWDQALIDRKSAEVDAVARAYGMASVRRLGHPTTQLERVPQGTLIDDIRNAVAATQPEIVYTVHHGDVHTDHFAAFTAAMSVLKTFYMRRHGVRRVLSFETLSSTEAAAPLPHRAFVPNVYHDVSPFLERKLEIMALFASEEQADPFPRGPSALRALARFRGASVGVEYAEAFVLVREVD